MRGCDTTECGKDADYRFFNRISKHEVYRCREHADDGKLLAKQGRCQMYVLE